MYEVKRIDQVGVTVLSEKLSSKSKVLKWIEHELLENFRDLEKLTIERA